MMNPSLDTPVYNLKAVVRETGLKPDTIRAWERRYNVPEPQRADSGHRLYSQNDVNMLKWLISRQNEGMSISRAVVLWRQLQASKGAPTYPESVATTLRGNSLVADREETHGPMDRLALLRDTWINHCLHFDEQGAERILSEAFALFPTETVCADLIQRGIANIGDSWHKGKVTVQQEHFASALAMRRLEALISATPAPTRTNRILIGCPPGEMHTLAPMMLTLGLRRRGWDVIFLGADIPLQDMIVTTQVARPQLIVLVAQLLHTAAALWEMAQLLTNEQNPLAYGGRIFAELPELRLRIPGYYLGDHLGQATQQIQNILALPRSQPIVVQVTDEYSQALRDFRRHQVEIEADVWRQLSRTSQPEEPLARMNAHLGRNMIAALTLGDLNFLQLDLAWLQEMYSTQQRGLEEKLAAYLRAYSLAVDRQMGSRGALVSRWLQQTLALNFAERDILELVKA